MTNDLDKFLIENGMYDTDATKRPDTKYVGEVKSLLGATVEVARYVFEGDSMEELLNNTEINAGRKEWEDAVVVYEDNGQIVTSTVDTRILEIFFLADEKVDWRKKIKH